MRTWSSVNRELHFDNRYVKACGAPDGAILPSEHVRATLEAIHKNCVAPFDEGRFGAVNGALPNGSMDTSSVQSEEFWTGSIYALAAAMMQEVRRTRTRSHSPLASRSLVDVRLFAHRPLT